MFIEFQKTTLRLLVEIKKEVLKLQQKREKESAFQLEPAETVLELDSLEDMLKDKEKKEQLVNTLKYVTNINGDEQHFFNTQYYIMSFPLRFQCRITHFLLHKTCRLGLLIFVLFEFFLYFSLS